MEAYLHSPICHYDVHTNNFTFYVVYFLSIVNLLFFKYFWSYLVKKKGMGGACGMHERKSIGFW